MYYFPVRRIQRAGAFISILLSAILLIGDIVCLHAVSSRSWGLRMGMIVLFTTLFAVVVGLLTSARRAEIFASTAAYVRYPTHFQTDRQAAQGLQTCADRCGCRYAAVLAVSVGGGLGNS